MQLSDDCVFATERNIPHFGGRVSVPSCVFGVHATLSLQRESSPRVLRTAALHRAELPRV